MAKKWQDIIGHEDIVKRLRSMLKAGRRPHAFLFSGPSGIGKSLVAEVFAAALLCERADAPCGVCPACCRLGSGNQADYHRLEPDGASIKIEQIRRLQRETALAPYGGGCRVVVIDGAELMTDPAANSLLKTLEEPEGDSVFILLAAARQMLLPTILSRCMSFAFNPLPFAKVENFLVGRGVLPALSVTAARLSGGRLGAAIALTEENGLENRDAALAWLRRLQEDGLSAAWTIAAQWDKSERPVFLRQLESLTICLRDLMVLQVAPQSGLVVNVDSFSALEALLPRWREETLALAWQAIEKARRAVLANANVRLTGEALLIRLEDLME